MVYPNIAFLEVNILTKTFFGFFFSVNSFSVKSEKKTRFAYFNLNEIKTKLLDFSNSWFQRFKYSIVCSFNIVVRIFSRVASLYWTWFSEQKKDNAESNIFFSAQLPPPLFRIFFVTVEQWTKVHWKRVLTQLCIAPCQITFSVTNFGFPNYLFTFKIWKLVNLIAFNK